VTENEKKEAGRDQQLKSDNKEIKRRRRWEEEGGGDMLQDRRGHVVG
jgi:hypothetical protein